MTRGRPPRKAAKEALPCADRRGGVVEIPDTSGMPYDLMIFSPLSIVFVKVKRMRARVQGPKDAGRKYPSEIRALRLLPESTVAQKELWVLSSHAVWQYFRVLPDRVEEIRGDGTFVGGNGQDGPVRTDEQIFP
jgi:hypothetical protein